MQILQPSLRLVKTFLQEYPEVTQKYVDTSKLAISHVLTPLNVFMRHLLLVQGLDPDSNPGEKAARELQAAMDAAFSPHDKDYDDDYDVGWVQKRFEETRKHLKDLQLTKERFMDLTDLSKLPQEVKKQGAVFIVTNENSDLKALQEIANTIAPEGIKRETRMFVDGDVTTVTADPINALKEALFNIEKDLKPSTKDQKTSKKRTPKGKVNKVTRVSKSNIKRPLAGGTAKHDALIKRMVEKGLCASSKEAQAQQMQEMLKWTDEALDSLGRVIERAPTNKKVGVKKFNGNFRRVNPGVK